MRITVGSGNTAKTVTVASGESYRKAHHVERQRFVRNFCELAGIPRT